MDTARELNISLCELLGIDYKGRAIRRVLVEIVPHEYPRVTVEEAILAELPGSKGRTHVQQWALVPYGSAVQTGTGSAFPPGSVRDAVARHGDAWRSAFYHRPRGYALDAETVSHAQARDMAVTQRASDRQYHGTLWDARAWSGLPAGERVRAVYGL